MSPNMAPKIIVLAIVAFAGLAVYYWWSNLEQFRVPEGETKPLEFDFGQQTSPLEGNEVKDQIDVSPIDPQTDQEEEPADDSVQTDKDVSTSFETSNQTPFMSSSKREQFVTDGTKHSIPLDEILPTKQGKHNEGGTLNREVRFVCFNTFT